jgi:hypothetical protein
MIRCPRDDDSDVHKHYRHGRSSKRHNDRDRPQLTGTAKRKNVRLYQIHSDPAVCIAEGQAEVVG